MPAGWGVLYCITDTHECAADFTADFRPEQWVTRGAGAPPPPQNGDSSVASGGGGGDSSPAKTSRGEQCDFIPFGSSRRTCPGQEFAKQMLRLLLVELCTVTEWQCDNPHAAIKSAPVPFPADGLPVRISLRD